MESGRTRVRGGRGEDAEDAEVMDGPLPILQAISKAPHKIKRLDYGTRPIDGMNLTESIAEGILQNHIVALDAREPLRLAGELHGQETMGLNNIEAVIGKVTPPCPRMWIEGDIAGVFVEHVDMHHLPIDFCEMVESGFAECSELPRYVVIMSCYFNVSGRQSGPMVQAVYAMDKHHRLLRVEDEVHVLVAGCLDVPGFLAGIVDGSTTGDEMALAMGIMVFFVCGLTHQSNVMYAESHTNEHRSESKRWKARLPWLRYFTLVIKQGTEIRPLRPAGTPSGEGRPQRLVRACFADYTKGKGLFSKYNIRVFKPAHYRGEAEFGVHVKDYKVVA